ncbi:hypothetical protein U0070_007110 [Myodes glareolus]|uniref:Uncharacterized protein n=1 Tax=Myodes glareolus TaxID=447135 RepID=A0AAW0HA44_MYOGA
MWLADAVTPLWRLSYEEQLKVKFEAQKTILQRLESYLQFLHGVHGTAASPHSEGLHCRLHPIIPSQGNFIEKQIDSTDEKYAVKSVWIISATGFPMYHTFQPIINGYRNKSTFSVNRGLDGNPKTVGYYLGTWRESEQKADIVTRYTHGMRGSIQD